MKILVDSSLASKDNWYDLIPLNLTLDQKDIVDYNNQDNAIKIINAKSKHTSFVSPELVREKLAKDDINIIFTIPKSLSGQYQTYISSDFKNTLVLEGHCFFMFKEEIKKLIHSNLDIESIKEQINKLNNKTNYDGLITSSKSLPIKGRIKKFAVNTLSTFDFKFWIKFKNGKWNKYKSYRNTKKVLRKIIEKAKSVSLICYDGIIFNKYKNIIKGINDIKIEQKSLTNAMIAHVGKDFIGIIVSE